MFVLVGVRKINPGNPPPVIVTVRVRIRLGLRLGFRSGGVFQGRFFR